MVNFEIGVFQGDVASPILFLCVINLVTELLNSPKYESSGALLFKDIRVTNFSFADDLNLLASSIKNATTQLEAFKKFIDWTQCFIAAPEKFGAIAYKKGDRKIAAYDPNLIYGSDTQIPPLNEKSHIFKILGKQIACSLYDKKSIQKFVEKEVTEILDSIENDNISNHHKITAYKIAFRPFAAWTLSVNEIKPGWIINNINPIGHKYLKKWAHVPSKGANDYYFYRKKGLDLLNIYDIYRLEKCINILTLQNSNDPIIQMIYTTQKTAQMKLSASWSAYRETDSVVKLLSAETDWNKKTPASQRQKIIAKIKERFQAEAYEKAKADAKITIDRQDNLLNCDVLEFAPYKKVADHLSSADKKFYTSVFLNSTITNSKLLQWAYRKDAKCDLCGDENQTAAHVLNNCPYSLGKRQSTCNRYLWRHNLVLAKLIELVKPFIADDWKFVADIEPYAYDEIPFNLCPTGNFKPDLIFYREVNGEKEVIIAELTVPLTHNVTIRHEEKLNKYSRWLEKESAKIQRYAVIAFEVSSETGYVSHSLSELFDLLNVPAKKQTRADMMLRLTVEAVRGSAKIMRCRNNHHFET